MPDSVIDAWSRFIRRHEIYAAIIFVSAAAAYLPALTSTFGYADDYPGLADLQLPQYHNRLIHSCDSFGRPMQGRIVQLAFEHARTVENLGWVRACTVLGVVLLGFFVYFHLLRSSGSRIVAVTAATIVITLPGFGAVVTLANSMPHPWAAVLSFPAYLLIRGANSSNRHNMLIRAAGAVVILIVALCTYPPPALFFIFWMLADLLFSKMNCAQSIRLAIPTLLTLFVSCVIYMAGIHLFAPWSPRRQIVHDLPGKAVWYFQHVIPSCFRFNFFELPPLAGTICAVTALGLPLIFSIESMRLRLLRFVAIALMLPLAFVSSLAADESFATYRSQIAMMAIAALAVIYAIWTLSRSHRFLRPSAFSLIMILAVGGVIKGAYNLDHYVVYPQTAEYAIARIQLQWFDPMKTHCIYYIAPDRSTFLAPFSDSSRDLETYYDEYNTPTTIKPENWRMGTSLILMALQKVHPEIDIKTIEVHQMPQRPAPIDPNAYVVNMRWLQNAW